MYKYEVLRHKKNNKNNIFDIENVSNNVVFVAISYYCYAVG